MEKPAEKKAKIEETVAEEFERVVKGFNDRLEKHDECRKAVQKNLASMCIDLKKKVDELEGKIAATLEEKFTEEDNRLQKALNELRVAVGDCKDDSRAVSRAIERAKAELLVTQRYVIRSAASFCPCKNGADSGDSDDDDDDFEMKTDHALDIAGMYELATERDLDLEWLCSKSVVDQKVVKVVSGRIYLEFAHLNPHEESILAGNGFENAITYRALLGKYSEGKGKPYPLKKHGEKKYSFLADALAEETNYVVSVQTLYGGKGWGWCKTMHFTTPVISEYCTWKECPDSLDYAKRYSVSEGRPRVAKKDLCVFGINSTIIGSAVLPPNKVTPWDVRILKSANSRGGILVGVAPFDIDQNSNENQRACGWYFHCFFSTLWSGLPHDYKNKDYGPRKEDGQYVRTGDPVGVVMDTAKAELSFVLGGVNLGVAYEGIPLEKPLVPCVILWYAQDTVEIVI